jgi:NAD+-dependent protein deacetylase sirtuin 2
VDDFQTWIQFHFESHFTPKKEPSFRLTHHITNSYRYNNMKAATPTSLAELAHYILSPECRRINILTGAGVSVAADIPDFRSPGGLYDTLRPDLLTASAEEKKLLNMDPTYVVSWEIFRRNQLPYLEVRRPFILGTRDRQWKATIAHRFFELLHVKLRKLQRLYTQNIDGLEYQCNQLPRHKIVAVHGSLGTIQCEGCGRDNDYDAFCDAVAAQIKDIYNDNNNTTTATTVEDIAHAPATPGASSPAAGTAVVSTPILCEHCNEPLVKPATVLFGRNLPVEFFRCRAQDLPPDLLIIAGTSLQVSPANSVVQVVPASSATTTTTTITRRVLVNRELVGANVGFGVESSPSAWTSSTDLFLQGDCDDVFLQLIVELGWLDDLPTDLTVLPISSRAKVEQARTENAYKTWF